MSDLPYLTKQRWACLHALRRQPRMLDRAFLAKELLIHYRDNGPLKPASGAMMDSLRDAGWIERVVYDFGGSGAPFRMGRPVTMWQITDAGREAIRQCPDIFPGEPVYGRKP